MSKMLVRVTAISEKSITFESDSNEKISFEFSTHGEKAQKIFDNFFYSFTFNEVAELSYEDVHPFISLELDSISTGQFQNTEALFVHSIDKDNTVSILIKGYTTYFTNTFKNLKFRSRINVSVKKIEA